MKIDFILVGGQKGGTSALDFYLRQHPEIGMPKQKELHFFDNEDVFSKQPIDYSLFENQFERKEGLKIYGEVTPIYMYWPPSMKRIWEYNEKMKVIAILRNPLERAFSHWNMKVNLKQENKPFLFCIQHEADRIREPLSKAYRLYSYSARGFYAEQIRRIQRYFPKGQVHFMKYEDFLYNQEQSIYQLLNFLGVNLDLFTFEYKEVLKTDYKSTLSKEEKRYLLKIYESEIFEVERLLNWDCRDWRH